MYREFSMHNGFFLINWVSMVLDLLEIFVGARVVLIYWLHVGLDIFAITVYFLKIFYFTQSSPLLYWRAGLSV